MSGFFRCPPDAWPIAVEAYSAAVDQWSEEMVVADLAWWWDRVRTGTEERMPGRRDLAKRWGWSDWSTRKALREEGRWKPPGEANQPSANPGPTQRQPKRNGAKPRIAPKPTQDQPRTNPSPSTRVKEIVQSAETETDLFVTPSSDDGWATVVAAWKARHPGGLALDRSRGGGRLIASMVKQHGADACLLVLDWVHDCRIPGSHAQRLRDGNFCRIKTLFAATNFEDYYDKARAWDAAGRPTHATPTAAADPRQAGHEAWADVLRRGRLIADRPPAIRDSQPDRWELADSPEERARRRRAVQAAGGWVALCRQSANDAKWAFVRAYEDEMRRAA